MEVCEEPILQAVRNQNTTIYGNDTLDLESMVYIK